MYPLKKGACNIWCLFAGQHKTVQTFYHLSAIWYEYDIVYDIADEYDIVSTFFTKIARNFIFFKDIFQSCFFFFFCLWFLNGMNIDKMAIYFYAFRSSWIFCTFPSRLFKQLTWSFWRILLFKCVFF